jgi:hypothetical protein
VTFNCRSITHKYGHRCDLTLTLIRGVDSDRLDQSRRVVLEMATIVYDIARSTNLAKSDLLNGAPTRSSNANTRAVGEQIMNAQRARVEMKDTTSSKLNIKGPHAADRLKAEDMKLWRIHLDKFPEIMLETARQNRLIDQDVRTRDLQEFQFYMVKKIEGALRGNMEAAGLDIFNFRIGGHDRGTYERFYRIEPGKFMSKPQFFTAIRRSFGDELIKSQGALSKLYDSFDPDHCDEMDWRAFLFLLTIFMQPHDNVFTHLRWAFAIYSSIGTLDFEECPESMSVGQIKDMIVVPTLMRFRKDIKQLVENSWFELVNLDKEAEIITTKHGDRAIDLIQVNYRLFTKLIKETSMSALLTVSATFGRMDPRPWTYTLETEYYHHSLVDTMRKLRREIRDEAEVIIFQNNVQERVKKRHFRRIVDYVLRRAKVRKMILLCGVRWKNQNVSTFFDRWRYTVLVNSLIKQIQRIVRGFNARRRARFIKRMQKRVVRVQAGVRSIRRRIEFNHFNKKRVWAAKIIQKYVRGRQARIKVVSRIESIFELGVRMIGKERVRYYKEREDIACVKVQMAGRRFLVRCRIIHRVENRLRLEALAAKMDMEKEKARVATELYRKEIEEWYRKRKEDYDLTVMDEGATGDARKKIIAYRTRQREIERLEREARKEELLEKQEEQRIEMWIKTWEEKIISRVEIMGRRCHDCLIMPETPADIELAKRLSADIKAHVKRVLRRADKQKIPMEIPEAQDLAKKEIIDQYMEQERVDAKAEMRAEAEKGQKELEEKHAREWQNKLREKDRKRDWAIYIVVGFFRMVIARKKLRRKAFERYDKHFDIKAEVYFYEDKRTGKVFWNKPKSLDAYDIKGDPGWVVLFDKNGDQYYYQPSTWKMSWDQPYNSALCMECTTSFAIVRITDNKQMLCETCFNTAVQKMLNDGISSEEIRFKPFHGNRDNSMSTIFSYIKEQSWWQYLLENDPTLKQSEAEAAHQKKMELLKKGIRGEPCGRCGEKEANRICDQCSEYFCVDCYIHKHAEGTVWANHSYKVYEYKGKNTKKGGEAPKEEAVEKESSRGRSRSPKKATSSKKSSDKKGKSSRSKSSKKRGDSASSSKSSKKGKSKSKSPGNKLKNAVNTVKTANKLKKSKSPKKKKNTEEGDGGSVTDSSAESKKPKKSKSPNKMKAAVGKLKTINELKKKKKKKDGEGDAEKAKDSTGDAGEGGTEDKRGRSGSPDKAKKSKKSSTKRGESVDSKASSKSTKSKSSNSKSGESKDKKKKKSKSSKSPDKKKSSTKRGESVDSKASSKSTKSKSSNSKSGESKDKKKKKSSKSSKSPDKTKSSKESGKSSKSKSPKKVKNAEGGS